MEPTLQSNNLHAFNMIRRAAREYSGAEYKFYSNGFCSYVVEDKSTLFIQDIYIEPEFRGTPLASIMIADFMEWVGKQGIIFIYGYVMKVCKLHDKRVDTFENWGFKVTNETDDYSVVAALYKDLK